MFSRKMSPVEMVGHTQDRREEGSLRSLARTGRSDHQNPSVSLSGHSSGVGVSDANVLGFEVFLDAFGTTLATESGLLDTAEGCRGI
jgi:hypothetical protein